MTRKNLSGVKVLTADVKTGTPRKLVGVAKANGFTEDEAGKALLKATVTAKDVKDLNRQRLTDAANDMRVGKSVQAQLKKLRAENVDAKREIDAVMRKHGIAVT